MITVYNKDTGGKERKAQGPRSRGHSLQCLYWCDPQVLSVNNQTTLLPMGHLSGDRHTQFIGILRPFSKHGYLHMTKNILINETLRIPLLLHIQPC